MSIKVRLIFGCFILFCCCKDSLSADFFCGITPENSFSPVICIDCKDIFSPLVPTFQVTGNTIKESEPTKKFKKKSYILALGTSIIPFYGPVIGHS